MHLSLFSKYSQCHKLIRCIHFKVFELISGGELFYYIQEQGKLTEKVASEFYRQLLSGIPNSWVIKPWTD